MSLVSWLKAFFGYERAWRDPFNRACEASGKGDWDGAITEYSEAIRINPRSAEAFFNRAIIYTRKDEWELAAKDCTEAFRLNPRHLKALHWRGILRRAQGRFDEAVADFSQALEMKPRYARAYFDRGAIYTHILDYPKALADYTKAIELGLDAFHERGLLHIRMGNYDLASKDMTETIRRQGHHFAYRNRAHVHYQQEDFRAAIADMDEAIRLAPLDASYYSTRAFFYHASGDYAAAIRDDREALKLDEKCFRSHNGLAWILATCPDGSLRNGEQAVVHGLKAVEFGETESLAPLGTLAAAYAEVGNFEEALRLARKFLDSDPPKANIESARLRLSCYEQGKPFREEKGKLETIAYKPRASSGR